MEILTDREKKLVLILAGLRDAFHQTRQDLHWTHGMLDSFGACTERTCVSARQAFIVDLGPYGQDLNQSVNLWNDLGSIREFASELCGMISGLPDGLSPAADALKTRAKEIPFGLTHGSS